MGTGREMERGERKTERGEGVEGVRRGEDDGKRGGWRSEAWRREEGRGGGVEGEGERGGRKMGKRGGGGARARASLYVPRYTHLFSIGLIITLEFGGSLPLLFIITLKKINYILTYCFPFCRKLSGKYVHSFRTCLKLL